MLGFGEGPRKCCISWFPIHWLVSECYYTTVALFNVALAWYELEQEHHPERETGHVGGCFGTPMASPNASSVAYKPFCVQTAPLDTIGPQAATVADRRRRAARRRFSTRKVVRAGPRAYSARARASPTSNTSLGIGFRIEKLVET